MGFSDRTERLLSAISYLPPPLIKVTHKNKSPDRARERDQISNIHRYNQGHKGTTTTMKAVLLTVCSLLAATPCMGFAPIHHAARRVAVSSATLSTPLTLQALPMDVMDLALNSNNHDAITNMMASSSMILSETEAWVQPLSLVMGPTLNFFSFAMVRFASSLKVHATILICEEFMKANIASLSKLFLENSCAVSSSHGTHPPTSMNFHSTS